MWRLKKVMLVVNTLGDFIGSRMKLYELTSDIQINGREMVRLINSVIHTDTHSPEQSLVRV